MAQIFKSLIGETLDFTWPILTSGKAVSLEGRNLTLELVNPNYETIPLDFTIEHTNVVCFTYEGKDQTIPGVYQVTLYENKGELNQAVVDEDAFELVETIDLYNWGNNTTLWSITKKESTEDGGVNSLIMRFSNRKTFELHTRNGSRGSGSYNAISDEEIDSMFSDEEGAQSVELRFLSADGLRRFLGKLKTLFADGLGVSGDSLTWTRNGHVVHVTVPFATKAANDGNGNNIANTYATKAELAANKEALIPHIKNGEWYINDQPTGISALPPQLLLDEETGELYYDN